MFNVIDDAKTQSTHSYGTEKILLSNGVEATFRLAPMFVAQKYVRLIAKTLSANSGLKSLINKDEGDTDIASIMCKLLADEEIYNVALQMLGYSFYDGINITEKLFDNRPEARGVFLEMVSIDFKRNIPIFFSNLNSLFETMMPAKTSTDQKQK